MKNSHFVTPRTLADCQFTVGYSNSSIADSSINRLSSMLFPAAAIVISFLFLVIVCALYLA
jgi:hypothetical protein